MKVYIIKVLQNDFNSSDVVIFGRGYTDIKKARDVVLKTITTADDYEIKTPDDCDDLEDEILSTVFYCCDKSGLYPESFYYTIDKVVIE